MQIPIRSKYRVAVQKWHYFFLLFVTKPQYYLEVQENSSSLIFRQFELVNILNGAVNGGSEVFGYILQFGKIIIAFRGTDTEEDWVKNVDIALVPYNLVRDAGSVHKGFCSIYTVNVNGGESLRDTVYSSLIGLCSLVDN